MIILGIIIGYFIGMVSCLWQVMTQEEKYDKKIKDIFNGFGK